MLICTYKASMFRYFRLLSGIERWYKLGMVAHTCDPLTQEAETKRLPQIWEQHGLDWMLGRLIGTIVSDPVLKKDLKKNSKSEGQTGENNTAVIL